MPIQLETQLNLADLVKAPNIGELLSRKECDDIARWVKDGYENDVSSRKDWADRNAEALKLALQVREEKTEPWTGCSNVKFPLVTIAAINYHARAYPLLINTDNLVTCKVYGPDPDGKRYDIAQRIGAHMTWQNVEQMPEWESEHDKAILIQGILGVAVIKRYFDPIKRRQAVCAIGVDDFVVNYFTRGDVNEAPRATHVMEFTPNDVYERVTLGIFCDDYDEAIEGEATRDSNDSSILGDGVIGVPEEGQAIPPVTELSEVKNERTGQQRPALDATAPIKILEQMCWLDLDGDGYDEPYYATVEHDTGKLRRLVARYTTASISRKNGKVLCISPERAYVKFGLIPAPDGSWYDIGFGHLLGPINASVDTAINQMFDAGTMSTTGGGFLGRGARLKAGNQQFKPFEWKNLDSMGDDIRKNVFALPTKEPSQTLFQLMVYLIEYAERTASANEIQMGENIGQNTPASTARMMNQNGARIFAGCYKRTWRSFRDEYCIQFELNKVYLDYDETYAALSYGAGAMATTKDYRSASPFVCPTADPNVVSDQERIGNAQADMQLALTVPGFNRYEAVRRFLEAKRTPAIDRLFPRPPPQQGPNGQVIPGDLPVPPDPKLLTVQVKQQQVQVQAQKAQMDMRTAVLKMQQEAQLIGAQILELRARSVMELAQAKGVDQGQQIALIDSLIGAKKAHFDALTSTIAAMTDHISTIAGLANDAGNDQPSADGSGTGSVEGASSNAGVFSLPAQAAGAANGSVGGGGVH